MKKIIFSVVIFFGIVSTGKAQVLFSNAQTLQGGAWNIGINPVFADGTDNFALFFHGGYGLGSNSDLGLKLGFGWGGDTYVGLDYEKTLIAGKPIVSLYGGAHYWNDFGLDLGSKITFPIGNVRITTGLDMDLNFGEDANSDLDLYAPLWLPISLEVYLKKQLSLVFEGNIKLTNSAFTTIGGGINIYF